ncbi:MAG: heparinase II/III domain-containing protein, partial [Alphaproteobacteria bacterium]
MMISKLLHKVRQISADPVLRRWLIGRALGRWPAEPAFRAHCPPYLDGLLPLAPEFAVCSLRSLEAKTPSQPLTLQLAGEDITISPAEAGVTLRRDFDDVETWLSLHRFAWITPATDPAWVDVIWRAWLEQFSTPSNEMPWHPYTAGERAVNILRFAGVHGLPGDRDASLAVLAAHAPAIAARLEYFGDHHTSNHLANNGRALYTLGATLGMDKAMGMGLGILRAEAGRLFTASGMLREGSSHYHLLVLRLYEGLGLDEFSDTVRKARRAASALLLPGGLPLVGDISPDIAPDDVLATLDLKAGGDLDGDGWLRVDVGDWSGLWHASPEGFSHMPGHGHQDSGSFELHYGDEAVIVDAGRGAYGETGDAARYRSAAMHNGLRVDGDDPYPPNKPYYNQIFRRIVAGLPPVLKKTTDGVHLKYGDVRRDWRFDDDKMTIVDHVRGGGAHTVTRTLIT